MKREREVFAKSKRVNSYSIFIGNWSLQKRPYTEEASLFYAQLNQMEKRATSSRCHTEKKLRPLTKKGWKPERYKKEKLAAESQFSTFQHFDVEMFPSRFLTLSANSSCAYYYNTKRMILQAQNEYFTLFSVNLQILCK